MIIQHFVISTVSRWFLLFALPQLSVVMEAVSRPMFRQVCGTLSRGRRTYASQSTAYVPYQANSRILPLPPRPKPALSTFFTGKPAYANAVVELEDAVKANQDILRNRHIWPLPPRLQLEMEAGGWDKDDWKLMEARFGTSMDRAQFKRVTGLLRELVLLRRIAQRAGHGEVVLNVNSIIEQYKRPREARQKSTKDKKSPIDEFGRTVTSGRRKESSAKVWLIKTKTPEDFSKRIETALEIHARKVADPESTENPDYPALPTTEVLINHLSIHQHFPRPSDRELVLRPLRLTGTLGYFNIFGLTSGGGTSGQAGAVALGIARGVITFFPEMADILRRDGLLNRDPRMVERKKTGLAKARKRVSSKLPLRQDVLVSDIISDASVRSTLGSSDKTWNGMFLYEYLHHPSRCNEIRYHAHNSIEPSLLPLQVWRLNCQS
jgi:small subunit ribosomal protein S9